VTRRKKKHLTQRGVADRKARVAKLIAAGWIADESAIPPNVIPVDPDRINLGGSWSPPTLRYYSDQEFACKDCGTLQTWTAEDQQWYYEVVRAPYYQTAVRCRECRKKERQRKALARIAAGHDTQPPA